MPFVHYSSLPQKRFFCFRCSERGFGGWFGGLGWQADGWCEDRSCGYGKKGIFLRKVKYLGGEKGGAFVVHLFFPLQNVNSDRSTAWV